jgi:hypothetical protein
MPFSMPPHPFPLEVELAFSICHQKLQAVNPVLGGFKHSIKSGAAVRAGNR